MVATNRSVRRSDWKKGGVSPASFMARFMVAMPVPLFSASFISRKTSAMRGFREYEPGSPSRSSSTSEWPGFRTSIRSL